MEHISKPSGVIALCLNLEDLKVLRRSPDLFNNVKIGQGHLPHINKTFCFTIYGGCSHFGQET